MNLKNKYHIPNPSVTIGIPVLNESLYIERVLNKFLDSGYNNLIEIIIADGGSTDNTTEIVQQIARKDKRVLLIHNPKKIQSAALNLMLNMAKGDIFLRADAHCDYDDDYVGTCVLELCASGALNVGGAQRFAARNACQGGIAMAVKSYFGSGGARYRDPDYDGFADTVFIGCFWKKALDDLLASENKNPEKESSNGTKQYFNEDNVTNQDAELNIRLNQFSNHAIYVSSKIRVWYYPRPTLKKLFIQYFKYGRGRYVTSLRHPGQNPLRSRIPFYFFSALMLLIICEIIFLKSVFFSAGIFGLLCAAIAADSARIVILNRKYFKKDIWRGKNDNPPSMGVIYIYCFTAIITMLVSHFSGYFFQVIKKIFTNDKNSW